MVYPYKASMEKRKVHYLRFKRGFDTMHLIIGRFELDVRLFELFLRIPYLGRCTGIL